VWRLRQRETPRIEDLEPANRRVLSRMQETIDAMVRDPARFLAQMHEIHLLNARAWANAAVGVDLASQIDPGFRFWPDAMRQPRSADGATPSPRGHRVISETL
jgi:CO dehydrogenase maturation factor